MPPPATPSATPAAKLAVAVGATVAFMRAAFGLRLPKALLRQHLAGGEFGARLAEALLIACKLAGLARCRLMAGGLGKGAPAPLPPPAPPPPPPAPAAPPAAPPPPPAPPRPA